MSGKYNRTKSTFLNIFIICKGLSTKKVKTLDKK
jgi:hypothetical protein